MSGDSSDAGMRFVLALSAKDTDALLGVLADGVVFRGMTPGRFWEATGARRAVEEVLYRWFEAADVVEAVEQLQTGEVAGRARVDYRLRVRNDQGLHLVEQRAYFDLDANGRMARVEAVCAGFRRLPGGVAQEPPSTP